MIVLTLLHSPALHLLRCALPHPATILTSANAAFFGKFLIREPVDVAVIDPAVERLRDDEPGVHPAARALAATPHVPFVLYFSFSNGAAGSARDFLSLAPSGMAMQRVDDNPAVLRTLLQDASERSLVGQVWRAIAGQVNDLPHEMQLAIGEMFRDPLQFHDVTDLCALANEPRRTFDRKLRRVGLAQGQRLLAAARVVRAYRHLAVPRTTCDQVVREMDYASIRRLQHDTKAVLERTPSQLKGMPAARFAGLVGEALVRREVGAEGGDVRHPRSGRPTQ